MIGWRRRCHLRIRWKKWTQRSMRLPWIRSRYVPLRGIGRGISRLLGHRHDDRLRNDTHYRINDKHGHTWSTYRWRGWTDRSHGWWNVAGITGKYDLDNRNWQRNIDAPIYGIDPIYRYHYFIDRVYYPNIDQKQWVGIKRVIVNRPVIVNVGELRRVELQYMWILYGNDVSF